MWLRHNSGDAGAALEDLATLPDNGYPDKLRVIAANWSSWNVRDHGDVLRAHIGPFATELADLLRVALDSDWAAAIRLGSRLNLQALTSADIPPDDLSRLQRETEALSRLFDQESTIDDLIDRGLVGDEIVDAAIAAAHPVALYLAARLRPESLDEAQLLDCGHAEELARRAFVARDKWRRFLPADHPALRRFDALERLGAGDAEALDDLLPSLSRHQQGIAAAVARSFRTGQIDVTALADNSTWPVLSRLVPRGEALEGADPAIHRLHEWRSLHDATEALYRWDWIAAADAAREALRTADDEDLRDEALNLLGCALHQMGNVQGAASALEESLKGVDSPDLIVNYGIVAAELDPIAASTELGRLAVEAPTLELRVTAARRALLLWGSHIAGEDEDDRPPETLVAAMRALSVEPTGADEHARIMKFLSWADDEWLADAAHTSASPYAATAPHRYLIARAKGPREGIDELAALHRRNPDDDYVVQECEDLAETLVRLMLDSGPALGAAVWGLAMSDADLPLELKSQVLIPVLAAREFALSMIRDDDNESTLKPELLTRVIKARKLAAQLDDPGPCFELIDGTVEAIAVACMPGWAAQLKSLADAHDTIIDRIGHLRRHQVNRDAVREFTDPMLKGIDDLVRYVKAVRQYVNATELVEQLDRYMKFAADIKSALVGLPR